MDRRKEAAGRLHPLFLAQRAIPACPLPRLEVGGRQALRGPGLATRAQAGSSRSSDLSRERGGQAPRGRAANMAEAAASEPLGRSRQETAWVETLRGDCEPEHHWRHRREFLLRNAGAPPAGDSGALQRLVSLSMVWANHVFLGCRYPLSVMEKVLEMAEGIKVTHAPAHTTRDELVAKVKKRGISSSNEGVEEPCKKRAVDKSRDSKDAGNDAKLTKTEVSKETESMLLKKQEKDSGKDLECLLPSSSLNQEKSTMSGAGTETKGANHKTTTNINRTSATPSSGTESKMNYSNPTMETKPESVLPPEKKSPLASTVPEAAKGSSQASTMPAAAKGGSQASTVPTAAKGDSQASTAPLAAKSDSQASTAPLAAKSDSQASTAPLAAKGDSQASTAPAGAKSDSQASTAPLAAKGDSQASTAPAGAKGDAKGDSQASTVPAAAKGVSVPAAAKGVSVSAAAAKAGSQAGAVSAAAAKAGSQAGAVSAAAAKAGSQAGAVSAAAAKAGSQTGSVSAAAAKASSQAGAAAAKAGSQAGAAVAKAGSQASPAAAKAGSQAGAAPTAAAKAGSQAGAAAAKAGSQATAAAVPPTTKAGSQATAAAPMATKGGSQVAAAALPAAKGGSQAAATASPASRGGFQAFSAVPPASKGSSQATTAALPAPKGGSQVSTPPLACKASALQASASLMASKASTSPAASKISSLASTLLAASKSGSQASTPPVASKSSSQASGSPAKVSWKPLTNEDAKERQPFFNRLYKSVAWKLVAVGGFSPNVNHAELLNSSIQSVKASLDVTFVPLKELADLPQNKSSHENIVCELRCKSVYLGTGCGKSKENAKAIASREALKLFLKKKVIVKICKRKYKGREIEDLVLLDEESKPSNLPPALKNPQEIL
ncbi:CDKN2A-interacting protein isoform X2 [Pelodiscus sinensis]|uniref:CDKN2A-interacting protein isoform X2 n=1 Tax=Pelodiscus sinensis TaxID=13735 RepID=UPI003F6B0225